MKIGQIIKVVSQSDLIVTPRLNMYLLSGRFDEGLPEDIAKRVYEELIKKPRFRPGTFSASSSGRCLRAQELAFLGLAPEEAIDPRLANIFSDGKWRHLRWQAMLLHAGILQDIEVGLPWPKMRSMNTIDGLGVVPDNHSREKWHGREFGLELKGVNSNPYRTYVKMDDEAKEDHLNQVHRYFLVGGFDLFVILYENKDSQEWHEWVIEADPVRLDAQRKELETLNRAIDKKALSPMLPECAMHKGATFRFCTFGGRTGPCIHAGNWPRLKKGKQ